VADATLRLRREVSPWRDKLRSYKILLDGKVIGTIANGATHDFTIVAGEHVVRLKIDWAGSPKMSFTVAAGEIAEFVCRAGGGAALGLLQSILTPGRYIQLEHR